MSVFDPLSTLSVILLQIGSRHLKFDITAAQEKIISHPYMQIIIFISIVYFSTKNLTSTIIIVCLTYIFIYVLFNENSEYHVLSKKWLHSQKILHDNTSSTKELYIYNLKYYNS